MYPNYVHKVSMSADCLQKVSILQEFIGHVLDTSTKYDINVTKKCPKVWIHYQQLSDIIHLQKISPKCVQKLGHILDTSLVTVWRHCGHILDIILLKDFWKWQLMDGLNTTRDILNKLKWWACIFSLNHNMGTQRQCRSHTAGRKFGRTLARCEALLTHEIEIEDSCCSYGVKKQLFFTR